MNRDDPLNPTCPCPVLLAGVGYECDSVNLKEQEAKDYWLQCILDMISTFRTQAQQSQSCNNTADQRAADFFESANQEVRKLSEQEYPVFSVRRLLDIIQANLRKHGFDDPWRDKKQAENEKALLEFRARLDEIDRITDIDAKWTELIKGVLAGGWLQYRLL